jgi:uncharacterized membrane protein YphA (DoxX/SURF4 family)
MNIILWIAQALLALVFLSAGAAKLTMPYEKQAERMGYVRDFSPGVIRAIGALEVLGALGVVLPALTGILPWLTPTAGVGLGLVMLGAIATHLRRKEHSLIVVNLVLLGLAAFVAYGRFVAVPL